MSDDVWGVIEVDTHAAEVLVVDIDTPAEPTPVYVPGAGVDLGPLTGRVDTLEASDVEQDSRLDVLEALSGGGLDAVQELIDDTVAVHVDAAEPHPVYDDLPSLQLLFENGLI